MRLVYIEWQDPTWHSDRNIDSDWSLIKQKTAGMLVKEDKNFIRIALTIDEDNIGEFIDIPKSLILKRYEYKTRDIK
ncbi:MAG: hypothetical protein QXJ14_03470 [Candidatus Aenigmatarchaeota archaeon]